MKLLLLLITALYLHLSVALDVQDELLPNFDRYPKWVSVADRNLLLHRRAIRPNIIVAKDDTGNYKTIGEAVEAMSKLRRNHDRFIVYVKKGVYEEQIEIPMDNVMFVGDGIHATIVTGNKNFKDGTNTYNSATFAVTGAGFMARDITFENTAGPQKQQAVALRSNADRSVFRHCGFKGYQDTLYVALFRQFYHKCQIYGTVDFIFGNAAVAFYDCNIVLRRPMRGQENTITAQGRDKPSDKTGILIINSRITASRKLKPVQKEVKSFLGRPWRRFSRTVIMTSTIDDVIDPAGWLAWNDEQALNTLYYAEYMNTGSGASTTNRVKWSGYHAITNPNEATNFSFENFFGWVNDY